MPREQTQQLRQTSSEHWTCATASSHFCDLMLGKTKHNMHQLVSYTIVIKYMKFQCMANNVYHIYSISLNNSQERLFFLHQKGEIKREEGGQFIDRGIISNIAR